MAESRPLAHGNGSIARPNQARGVEEKEEENIFLFYPNLIGTYGSRAIETAAQLAFYQNSDKLT
jgi:hypothetical protein